MAYFRYYHSLPDFLLRGFDYRMSVALDGAVGDVFVEWSAEGSIGRLRLEKETEGIKTREGLAIYSVTVPGDVFDALDKFVYRFLFDDTPSCQYTVDVAEVGKMPPMIITEMYLRPKGLNVTLFFEVMNPSDETIDLYDYKLLFYKGDGAASEDYMCCLTPCTERGKEILKPGEVAVLWPLLPSHYKSEDPFYRSVEGFISACMNDFPKPGVDLYEMQDRIRIIPVKASQYDDEQGKYVSIDNISALVGRMGRTTAVIAPRDTVNAEGINSAVYRVVYNINKYGDRDNPVRYSSLWTVDVRKPAEGVSVAHRALMTPGVLEDRQTISELDYPSFFVAPVGASVAKDGVATIKFYTNAKFVSSALVSLKLSSGEYVRLDTCEVEEGIYCATVPARSVYDLAYLEYVIAVSDGVRTVCLGTTQQPICDKTADICGPYIVSYYPTEKYCYDLTRKPEIKVEFYDTSGVDIAASILCVDKKNVSAKAKWGADCVSYVPDRPLKYGEHSFEIMLRDKLGNKTYKMVSFFVARPDELNLYHGEVHSHTAFSDGIATPREAYEYARYVGKVDFFAVTEHSHYLTNQLYFEHCDIADELDAPGSFAAIYGYEMTWNGQCGLWGHANVLNTKRFLDDIDNTSLGDFYNYLADDICAVGMFNHPGLSWGNFHDYSEFSSYSDRLMCLAEIKGAGYDREYMNMLTLGWHVSPSFNEDNHGYNWTTAATSTTYALAPALTRENILDAFRRRRTYSTTDPTMKIKFRVNGEWMGARIKATSSLSIDVNVSTECESGIGNISIVSEDNIVVATVSPGALREYHWRLKLSPEFDYYYVKITSAGKYAVTAPVWVERNDVLKVKRLSYKRGIGDYKPHVITARIKNVSREDCKSLVADFYLTGSSGFDLERAVPYRSVSLQHLGTGKTACIDCNIPDIVGARRVSVVVRATCGGKKYADTAMVQVSPIKIAEILPKSPEAVDCEGRLVANPFPYIKLCNLSNRDVCLDGYYTRLWTQTGKAPVEDRTLRLDGNVVKAGGVLTIWVRPEECSLSVDDFNSHYGVSMVEGDDLIITSVAAISSVKLSTRRLDLMFDKELMARVEYNFVQPPQTDINEGRAITYDVTPTMTGTSVMISNSADPVPDGDHIK